ncbi:helix-turn-helix domain-containing protein [Allopusillimonas soli]|uniref:Helix-turn-helix domain-containing protein n=1 Tax=Allopusillimonas soli TaxID=659016 RepID=A0A853FBI2_9BURK|nr:helix-turn-helix domain-containing protein [Allopusillimonas soli]NYT37317.1 helix-turn-helix domain-containing protein [Allopusillimonas soli]TEA74693.1 helix-turn-helix domain-containing protein [Allopusillimonas soli]
MASLLLRTPPRYFDRPGPWHDGVCEYFVPLEVRAKNAGPFLNTAAHDSLGCLRVTELLTSAQRVSRTKVLASRAEEGLYKATLQLSGRSRIVQADRTAILNPGEWGLYDTARPYEVDVEQDAHFLVLQISPAQMPVWAPYLQRAVARAFSARHGSARIAMDTLRLALSESPSLSDAAMRDIAASIMQMIGLNVCEQTGAEDISGLDEVRQAQFRTICQHIEDNLHDPGMTASGIAARFRISRRYLYKLFESHGASPADYIQAARLERCRRMLANTAATQQISDLAYRHGFSDAAAFSHAFRRRYGVSPTEWRRQQTNEA